MLLAIDVGNTNIVVGIYRGAELTHRVRLSTDHHRTEHEYAVLIREMLHDLGVSLVGIQGAVLASVVPPLTPVMATMCETRFGVRPLIIGPGTRTGMPIRYESPRDVGADRVVNGIAGYERFRHADGGPYGVIIVDFGTATTFDVVSPAGEYLGGAIAPGVVISTEALYERAAKLPRVDLVLPKHSLGKNTVESMQSGILFGAIAMLDGMVERLQQELDFKPRVLATGGIARLVAPHARMVEAVDDDLTLRGLHIIYERQHTP